MCIQIVIDHILYSYNSLEINGISMSSGISGTYLLDRDLYRCCIQICWLYLLQLVYSFRYLIHKAAASAYIQICRDMNRNAQLLSAAVVLVSIVVRL